MCVNPGDAYIGHYSHWVLCYCKLVSNLFVFSFTRPYVVCCFHFYRQPTKDRARKPRKQHENQSQRSQSSTPPSPSADPSRKGLEESIVPPTSVQIVENRYEAQPDVFNDGVGDKNQQIKNEQLKIAVLTSGQSSSTVSCKAMH